MEDPLIDERAVGRARVAIVSAGVIDWKAEFNVPREEWIPATPEAGPDGRLRLGTNFVFADTGSSRILVDPCVWDAERLKGSSIELVSHPTDLEEALVRLDVGAPDVSHVLITHAHSDHCSGVAVAGPHGYRPRFPSAVHILNRLDWEQAQRQPGSEVRDLLQPIADSGRLLLVDGTYRVEDGIRFIHAPGETPGHSVVELTSESQTFFYVGDLFHVPAELVHTDWIPTGRDLQATIASRTWLIESAVAADASVVFTHSEFPGWGRIEQNTPQGARWLPD